MGRIPEFTRTVLPDRALESNVDMARAQSDINRQAVTQQGAIDVGNIREKRAETNQMYNTINDYVYKEAQARNATAVAEGAINYRRTMIERQDALRTERQDAPDNFAKDADFELEQSAVDLLNKAPSSAARQALKERVESDRSQVYQSNLLWERQRKTEIFADSLERSAGDLNVLAYRAGQRGESLDALMDDVEVAVAAGSKVVSGDKVQTMRETMRRGVVTNMLEGLAASNPYAMQRRLKSGEFDADLRAEDIQALENKAEAEINKHKAEARVSFNAEMDEIEKAASMGLSIPAEVLEKQAKRAGALGMGSAADRIRKYAEVQDYSTNFAKLPIEQQKSTVVEMKNAIEAGDTSSVDLYAASAKILKTKADVFADGDALKYYEAHKVIDDIGELNFNDPKNLAELIPARRTAVQQIKDVEGFPVPMFTSSEVKQLEQIVKDAPPEQVGAVFAGLRNSLNEEEMASLASSMSKQNAVLGVALAVDGNKNKTAEKIIAGTALEGLVKKADVKAAVDGKIGRAVGNSKLFEQTHDAIYAAYKQNQFQSGDTSTTVVDDILKKTLSEVVGPVYEVGNSQVLSFRRDGEFVDEDTIFNLLTDLTDDDLKNLNGSLPQSNAGRTLTAAQLKQYGRWVTLGTGKYGVVNDVGEYAANADWSAYVIDLRKLMDAGRGVY
jgi:hypothetical protein